MLWLILSISVIMCVLLWAYDVKFGFKGTYDKIAGNMFLIFIATSIVCAISLPIVHIGEMGKIRSINKQIVQVKSDIEFMSKYVKSDNSFYLRDKQRILNRKLKMLIRDKNKAIDHYGYWVGNPFVNNDCECSD